MSPSVFAFCYLSYVVVAAGSISSHQQRLNLSVPADVDPEAEAKQKQVDDLNVQIKTLLEQMEALGEEGKVDESQALLKLVESMRSQKTVLEQVCLLRTGSFVLSSRASAALSLSHSLTLSRAHANSLYVCVSAASRG